MSIRSRLRMFGAATLVLGALAVACNGEDRPSVDVIEGGTPGSGSVSASGAGPAPTRVPGAGYSPVSDVNAYFNYGLDIRDMRTLMASATEGRPVDWANVTAIYERGKNSTRADGTLRTFAALATEAAVLAVFPNGATVYSSESFLDARMRAALNGTGRAQGISDDARRQIIDKTLQAIVYGKALQELESAKTRVEQRNLDNATGAPHAVDEGWAIVAGATDDAGGRPHSLLATAVGREGNFNLQGRLRDPLETAFIAALDASQKGDMTAYNRAHTEARGYLNAIFYLGALRYPKSLEADTTAAQRQVHLAEGWSFWEAIRATVASGSPPAAATVEGAYTRSPNDAFPVNLTTAVYGALNDPLVLQALGIPSALVVRTPPQ